MFIWELPLPLQHSLPHTPLSFLSFLPPLCSGQALRRPEAAEDGPGVSGHSSPARPGCCLLRMVTVWPPKKQQLKVSLWEHEWQGTGGFVGLLKYRGPRCEASVG